MDGGNCRNIVTGNHDVVLNVSDLVLSGNPIEDFSAVQHITQKVKQGHVLNVTATQQKSSTQ